MGETRIHQLDNGLQVVLEPRRHAPVAGFFVWYRVGSRHEAPGSTGLSHFLEHMCFKDTPAFPWKRYEEALYRRGALLNAFTSQDATCYFAVLPSEHLELAVAIEARRMSRVEFVPAVAIRERSIIVAEREGGENQPGYLLFEALQRAAFPQHPYGHMVIGSKEDIRAVTAESLCAHYAAYYRPNNAVALAVGDFDPDRVLAQIHRHFGGLGAPDRPIPSGAPAEPAQAGERRLEQRRPAPAPLGAFLFKVPATADPDTLPLRVLAALLGGVQGAGFGRSLSLGRSSRLYRTLVRGELAASVAVSLRPTRDPGVLTIHVTGRPDTDPARVEAALQAELAAVAAGRFTAGDLERARQQLRVAHLWGSEPVLGAAMGLGWPCMVHPTVAAGVAAHAEFLRGLDTVGAADVQRVAARYLQPAGLTAGWLIPAGGAERPAPAAGAPANGALGNGAPAPAPVPTAAPSRQNGRIWGADTGLTIASTDPRRAPLLPAARVYRQALPGGARCIAYPTPGVGVVTLRLWLPGAGSLSDPDGQEGLARLTAACLTRGHAGRPPEALDEQADATGIALTAAADLEGASVELRCLTGQLAEGLDLLAGALCRPDFPAAEVERLRQQLLTGLRYARANPAAMAGEKLRAHLYPPGHPFHRPEQGTEAALQALTRDHLLAAHRRHYGLAGLIAAASGDVDPAELAAALAARLAGWQGGPDPGAPAPVWPPPAPVPGREDVSIPGKSQSDIALGFPAVTRPHPDWLALAVAGQVLGGGLAGRLFKGVREVLGLSYYQRVDFPSTLAAPAPWSLRMGCATANVPAAVAALRLELERLVTEPVPGDEFAYVRDALLGKLATGLETPEQIAGWLLTMERFALGPDYVERYPDLLHALTPAAVQAAAARHLQPGAAVIVVAGPPSSP